ncbi:hypothetical protein HY989_02710 [Candidatus Micrarchaeota archaeon]|nr:hypothetical protein [Candidatus Micrarchaeota archaeon]
MPKIKERAGVPKIEGFERVKYHDLALGGLSARVYSAYFGRPKKIIDAFSILYGRGKPKGNTGRISKATGMLLDANYLDLYKVEKSNWPLLHANLLPLYQMFEKRKARLNEGDRKIVESALIGTPEDAQRFAITADEAQGIVEFIPAPIKMQAYLNSAGTLALLALFKQQAPQFKEEMALLRRIKEKTYGLGKIAPEEMAESQNMGIMLNFVDDLVLKTRVGIKEGEDLKNLLIFKIAKLSHAPEVELNFEEQVEKLFQ